MSRLGKMLNRDRHPTTLPEIQSTRRELEATKKVYKTEHERTDKLARILADYRAQDRMLRR